MAAKLLLLVFVAAMNALLAKQIVTTTSLLLTASVAMATHLHCSARLVGCGFGLSNLCYFGSGCDDDDSSSSVAADQLTT